MGNKRITKFALIVLCVSAAAAATLASSSLNFWERRMDKKLFSRSLKNQPMKPDETLLHIQKLYKSITSKPSHKIDGDYLQIITFLKELGELDKNACREDSMKFYRKAMRNQLTVKKIRIHLKPYLEFYLPRLYKICGLEYNLSSDDESSYLFQPSDSESDSDSS